MDCPFDPTPPNPLRFGLDLDLRGRPREPMPPRPAVAARPGMVTLADFCRRRGIWIEPDRRWEVARLLVAMTREARLDLGHVPDPKFGKINTYPIAILDAWRRRYN
jgi:hypothetical protein